MNLMSGSKLYVKKSKKVKAKLTTNIEPPSELDKKRIKLFNKIKA